MCFRHETSWPPGTRTCFFLIGVVKFKDVLPDSLVIEDARLAAILNLAPFALGPFDLGLGVAIDTTPEDASVALQDGAFDWSLDEGRCATFDRQVALGVRFSADVFSNDLDLSTSTAKVTGHVKRVHTGSLVVVKHCIVVCFNVKVIQKPRDFRLREASDFGAQLGGSVLGCDGACKRHHHLGWFHR